MGKKKKQEKPTNRSFRVRPSAWNKARQRAESEGVTITAAVGELVEGYAVGAYELPKVEVVRTFPRQ